MISSDEILWILTIIAHLFEMFCFRYAEQVLIGDEVLVKGNNELAPAKVINVSELKMQGNHHT